jgi:hypothetical protein
MAMAMCGHDRVCIAVLRATPPTDEEWARWIALLQEHAKPYLRVLVETPTGPNAAQRKALAQATRGEDIRFAILTDSIVVRGIVTALAWLGVPHRAFATTQEQQAADYLELTSAELERARRELPRLRGEAGTHPSKLASSG